MKIINLFRYLALLPALIDASDVKDVKNEAARPAVTWDAVSKNAIALDSTSNFTELRSGIEEIHGLMQMGIPENLALGGSQGIVEKMEGFGVTVATMSDVLSDMEAAGAIPSDMLPMVRYVKDQLQEASAQSTQIALEFEETKSALQLSLARAKQNTQNKHKSEQDQHEKHQQQRQQQQGKHQHGYEKMRAHPKMKHHLSFHEAMAGGNMDFVNRHMENLHRYHQSFEDQNHRRTEAYAVEQCQKLVSCVEHWSLYDVVSFYYGAYADDSGSLANNTDAADATGGAGIITHVNEIRKYMEETRSTNYALDSCKTLLNQFHTNEKKEKFSIYHGPTISTICRAQGSTQYMGIGEIRRVIGGSIADRLFDDMVKCSTALGDNCFFNGSTPRVPSKTLGDRHGKTRYNDVNKHFGFVETSPISGASNGNQKMSYEDIKRVDQGCIDRINKRYMDIYTTQETTLFKEGATDTQVNFPSLNIKVSRQMNRVYIGIGNDASASEQICEISSSDFQKCPQDKSKATTSVFSQCISGVTKFQVAGLFSGFQEGARDTASKLTLGDSMSIGMVCAFAEKARQDPEAEKVPGYCCLDTPGENSLWGDEYSCDDGKAKCNMLGPVLSGMSQSACDPWSGTFCPYPRDCSELKDCVAGEMRWANANNKGAYEGYLENVPEIKDVMSFDECGAVREYLGFKSDYPLDDEICEDVAFLRNDKNFNNLDANFGDNSLTPNDAVPSQKELNPPDDPEFTQEMYDKIDKQVAALQMGINTITTLSKISGYFECPEDISGIVKTACALVKNAMVIVNESGVQALQSAIDTINGQIPELENIQKFQIFLSTDALFGNMVIMNNGIGDIRKDIWKLSNADERRLSEHGNSMAKFAGCDGLDQDADGVSDNCEEDFTPPELVIPSGLGLETDNTLIVKNRVFKSDQDASAHLKTILSVSDDCAPASSLELDLAVVGHSDDSCRSTIRAKPVHVCDGFAAAGEERMFVVQVDSKAPLVTCGFNAQDTNLVEGKMLLMEEGHSGSIQLVDTGFFYDIKESCSKSVKVDISVKSSEYDAPDAGNVAMAKALAVTLSGVDAAMALVSPSTCESKKNVNGQMICLQSVSGRKERIYELEVTVTDEAGWTSQDTCRVVVVSKDKKGAVDSRALSTEEEPKMYHIDEVSLEWKPY